MDDMELFEETILRLNNYASSYMANGVKIKEKKFSKHYKKLGMDCASVALELRGIVTRLKKDVF